MPVHILQHEQNKTVKTKLSVTSASSLIGNLTEITFLCLLKETLPSVFSSRAEHVWLVSFVTLSFYYRWQVAVLHLKSAD